MSDKSADVYSFGIVLYELVTRQRAWQGHSEAAVEHAVVHGERPALSEAAEHRFAHTSLPQLMRACWAQESSERPPFAAILAELRVNKTTAP